MAGTTGASACLPSYCVLAHLLSLPPFPLQLDLPDRLIVPIGSLTFGVMGTGAASMPPGGGAAAEGMRRDMGVDVLV